MKLTEEEKQIRHASKIIEREISWLVGYWGSEDIARQYYREAAKKVHTYLEKKFFDQYSSNA